MNALTRSSATPAQVCDSSSLRMPLRLILTSVSVCLSAFFCVCLVRAQIREQKKNKCSRPATVGGLCRESTPQRSASSPVRLCSSVFFPLEKKRLETRRAVPASLYERPCCVAPCIAPWQYARDQPETWTSVSSAFTARGCRVASSYKTLPRFLYLR